MLNVKIKAEVQQNEFEKNKCGGRPPFTPRFFKCEDYQMLRTESNILVCTDSKGVVASLALWGMLVESPLVPVCDTQQMN